MPRLEIERLARELLRVRMSPPNEKAGRLWAVREQCERSSDDSSWRQRTHLYRYDRRQDGRPRPLRVPSQRFLVATTFTWRIAQEQTPIACAVCANVT